MTQSHTNMSTVQEKIQFSFTSLRKRNLKEMTCLMQEKPLKTNSFSFLSICNVTFSFPSENKAIVFRATDASISLYSARKTCRQVATDTELTGHTIGDHKLNYVVSWTAEYKNAPSNSNQSLTHIHKSVPRNVHGTSKELLVADKGIYKGVILRQVSEKQGVKTEDWIQLALNRFNNQILWTL